MLRSVKASLFATALVSGAFAVSVQASPPLEGALDAERDRVEGLAGTVNDLDAEVKAMRDLVLGIRDDAQKASDAAPIELEGAYSTIAEAQKQVASGPNRRGTEPAVYVLVSLGMSDAMLIDLLVASDRAGVQLVLRGLLDDPDKPDKISAKPTIARINALVSEAGAGGFNVDPGIFRQFKVERVPTFVSAAHPPVPGMDFEPIAHDMLSGSVSLEYALETLAREGEDAPAAAAAALERYQQN